MTAPDPHPIANLLSRLAAEVAELVDKDAPRFARICIVAHYPSNADWPEDNSDVSEPVIHRREIVYAGGELKMVKSVTEERLV